MRPYKNRKAVIDLGTNTFHLLIADIEEDGTWKEIFRKREYVFLASKGIGEIAPDTFDKGIETLLHFKEILDSHHVKDFVAVGTAALRTANNSQQFISQILERTGIEVKVIDGDEEAGLIARGVEVAIGDEIAEYLIMDIGGGSVEFIHRTQKGINWQQSFPIGLAVLKSREFFADPQDSKVRQKYAAFILEELKDLISYTDQLGPLPFVGASGTFEAILQLVPGSQSGRISRKFSFQDLSDAYEKVKNMTMNERLTHPGIPEPRAELFGLAMLLVYTVAEQLETKEIYISPYALKEGVLDTMK